LPKVRNSSILKNEFLFLVRTGIESAQKEITALETTSSAFIFKYIG
jgi:hypothetical protein